MWVSHRGEICQPGCQSPLSAFQRPAHSRPGAGLTLRSFARRTATREFRPLLVRGSDVTGRRCMSGGGREEYSRVRAPIVSVATGQLAGHNVLVGDLPLDQNALPDNAPDGRPCYRVGRRRAERMLSREENEFVSRVGPGTPMGGLMRAVLAAGDAVIGATVDGLGSGASAVAGRAVDCISGFLWPRGIDGAQLSASRGVAVFRSERRERTAMRLPRLEVQRRRRTAWTCRTSRRSPIFGTK